MERTVLIVEDDPQNLKLFSDLLQVKGYSALVATNGRQGVEIGKEKKPDLILMDIQMPVMDGLEALTILKADETTKEIPVVALTAYAMQGDAERLGGAGFDGYITKPIDIKEFFNKLAEYTLKGPGAQEEHR
ncbi:MAG: response regulator [Deltaproteobacteria bacterium]|nr:response regulator [Deltaproteobacteria bacterium]